MDQYGNPLSANSPRTITVTVYATRPCNNSKTVASSRKRRTTENLSPSSAALPPPPAQTDRPPVEPARPVQPNPEAPRPPQPATSKGPEPIRPKPEPIQPKPEPVQPKPKPEPVRPKPEPVRPKPEPVQPKPEPVQPKPEPVQPKPEPVRPKPEPVQPKPEPVQPKPEPVEPRPTTSEPPRQTGPASPSRPYTPGTYPSGNRPGIVYSPYNPDHSCKSAEQVAADVEQLKMFSPLRLYGVDCNQVQNVIAAAKKHGIQVFVGIWNVDKAALELETLIKAVNGQWDSVHTVAIGNEVVNFGRMSPSLFAAVINSSRKRLQQPEVGYYGPVVGVDTFVAILGNPAICEASDYVAANCHSFFDGNVRAGDSGKFLDNMKAELAKKCGDKKIVITGEYRARSVVQEERLRLSNRGWLADQR